jgi:hypothetical protein
MKKKSKYNKVTKRNRKERERKSQISGNRLYLTKVLLKGRSNSIWHKHDIINGESISLYNICPIMKLKVSIFGINNSNKTRQYYD